MFNADMPSRAELPTSKQLFRSTLIAAVSAAFILVAFVLPSEYAIDPTGIGRALGLTRMGEIKSQLAAEAKADRAAATPAVASIAPGRETPRRDEMTFTLAPGEGIEVKLRMREGSKASFVWTAEGGVVNFDTHGDGGGRSVSYGKGRGVASDTGEIDAAFDGNHGWFWRNRDRSDVRIVLRTEGNYAEIKRML
ncbi:transmembrane anchor protein [Burkholderia sp. BCC1993]|uniref:transmembrane anchor protein n=1 Tax=Burkholderia sp. BCC1993 TaxID=2817444 RepID=UPI002AB02A79|nr:transmembrane anchor protein [Burkholderia sp. BCC1993]